MTARTVWKQVVEFRSAGAVAAALVGLGFALAVAFLGYIGLPERVSAIEGANQRQDSTLVEVQRRESVADRKLDRVLCLVEAIAAEQDPVARGCVR